MPDYSLLNECNEASMCSESEILQIGWNPPTALEMGEVIEQLN